VDARNPILATTQTRKTSSCHSNRVPTSGPKVINMPAAANQQTLDSSPELTETLRSKELTPEAAATRSQRLQRVAAMLARLPKEQRAGRTLTLFGRNRMALLQTQIMGAGDPTDEPIPECASI